MQKMIQVLYTCGECSLTDVKLNVPAREKSEQIGPWIRATSGKIAVDHRLKSPQCKSPKIKDLKIPLNTDANSPVGSPIDTTSRNSIIPS